MRFGLILLVQGPGTIMGQIRGPERRSGALGLIVLSITSTTASAVSTRGLRSISWVCSLRTNLRPKIN